MSDTKTATATDSTTKQISAPLEIGDETPLVPALDEQGTVPLAGATADLAKRPVYRMPPEVYSSQEWFEREQRELFGRTWNLVGHVADVPAAGDFLAVTVGTEPVVVVRTAEGELHGFVNMCRHRGMTIVRSDAADLTGNCGDSLRCPYHGWEWTLDGVLDRVPQRTTQFPDIVTEDLPLFDVAIGTWRGWIFVHPDADQAEHFDEWLADFDDACGVYPWKELTEVYRKQWDVKSNWKLYIENHIDWLHLWYLHEDSLGMYDHRNGVIRDCGMHWASAERFRPGMERQALDGLLPIPGVTEDESTTLRANLLFPNVPFVTTGRSMQSYQIIPTGPETCRIDLRVFALPGGGYSEEGKAGAELVLYTEDGGACEKMQAAIHSPRFVVGPLAVDFEKPISDLHERLIGFMGAPPTGEPVAAAAAVLESAVELPSAGH